MKFDLRVLHFRLSAFGLLPASPSFSQRIHTHVALWISNAAVFIPALPPESRIMRFSYFSNGAVKQMIMDFCFWFIHLNKYKWKNRFKLLLRFYRLSMILFLGQERTRECLFHTRAFEIFEKKAIIDSSSPVLIRVTFHVSSAVTYRKWLSIPPIQLTSQMTSSCLMSLCEVWTVQLTDTSFPWSGFTLLKLSPQIVKKLFLQSHLLWLTSVEPAVNEKAYIF